MNVILIVGSKHGSTRLVSDLHDAIGRRHSNRGPYTDEAVDDDGQIHFTILPGSVAKNGHLLDRTVA